MEILFKFRVLRTNLIKSVIRRTLMSSTGRLNDAKEAAEALKTNPYYTKYATKIAKLQQTSSEEFMSRAEGREKEKTKPKFGATNDRNYSSLLEPKKSVINNVEIQDTPLSKIMKMELIEDKSATEVSKIWEEYHKNKDLISATVPVKAYQKMNENAKLYPTFLFPVPRSQGYEFIMCQFSRNTVHFTPLLHYQVHKENAVECLTITHYMEFKDSKGIVLMRGEFDKNTLNVQEAQCLANQLQIYYSLEDPNKTKLLEQFNMRPDQFKHMDLIKQIETLSVKT